MNAKDIALEAVAEGMHILNLMIMIDKNAWPTTSVPRANLDRMAHALGFPDAPAVQKLVEDNRQHATAKRRDAGW